MGVSARPCPTCRGPVESRGRWRPFCSERCKMVDLGRWFQGQYVVAGEDAIALDPAELEEHLRDLERRSAAARGDETQADGGDPDPDA